MEIGAFSYGSPEVRWQDCANLKIGKFCSIASNVKIYLGGNHNINWASTYPFGHTIHELFHNHNIQNHPTTKGDVIIGNDVWIADNVTIMSGVTIGDGAVIANNSHVIKDVSAYSITGGNPGKHIRFRFSLSQIDKLLKLKWWDLNPDKINELVPLLCSPNIDELINKLENGI